MPFSKEIKRPELIAHYMSIALRLQAHLRDQERECANCKDFNIDLWLISSIDLPSCKRYHFNHVKRTPYIC